MLETGCGQFSHSRNLKESCSQSWRFARGVLILHRLGHCRRACPVADVVVKVKPQCWTSTTNSRKWAYGVDRHPWPPPPQYIDQHPKITCNYAQLFVPMWGKRAPTVLIGAAEPLYMTDCVFYSSVIFALPSGLDRRSQWHEGFQPPRV